MKKKTSSSKPKAAKLKQDLNRKYSAMIVDGPERAASRAMLHAVGFERKDFKKSQIGVASTWGMVTIPDGCLKSRYLAQLSHQ